MALLSTFWERIMRFCLEATVAITITMAFVGLVEFFGPEIHPLSARKAFYKHFNSLPSDKARHEFLVALGEDQFDYVGAVKRGLVKLN